MDSERVKCELSYDAGFEEGQRYGESIGEEKGWSAGFKTCSDSQNNLYEREIEQEEEEMRVMTELFMRCACHSFGENYKQHKQLRAAMTYFIKDVEDRIDVQEVLEKYL